MSSPLVGASSLKLARAEQDCPCRPTAERRHRLLAEESFELYALWRQTAQGQ